MKTVTELIGALVIVDENVHNEAIQQPLLFIDAARYRVAKMRSRSCAEAELESFTASLGLMVRARGKEKGEERVTNDYIKSKIQRHPKFKRLRDRLQRAEEREEFSKLLLEAFRKRSDAIKILADAKWYEASKDASKIEKDNQNRRLRIEARRLQAKRIRNLEKGDS